MKIVNKSDMLERKRVHRVMTEREILVTADHPFIVTLHYSFQTPENLYFVMTYCAGGEFYGLLQRQPNQRISEHAAAFYAAQVLIALEYLHLLGYIYRDLKPENILVDASGHVVLTDFDLSKHQSEVPLESMKKPTLLVKNQGSSLSINLTTSGSGGSRSSSSSTTSAAAALCQCLSPRRNNRKIKVLQVDSESHLTKSPRRFSFLGTHEYIAPEIIAQEGYAGSVDWWAFGILIYEMLFSTTPFKGLDPMDTLGNIIDDDVSLTFPSSTVNHHHHHHHGIIVSDEAKDLLSRLLHKEVSKRLCNPYEIKQHPFFEHVDWALVRHTSPPEIPDLRHARDTKYFDAEYANNNNNVVNKPVQDNNKRRRDTRGVEEDHHHHHHHHRRSSTDENPNPNQHLFDHFEYPVVTDG